VIRLLRSLLDRLTNMDLYLAIVLTLMLVVVVLLFIVWKH